MVDSPEGNPFYQLPEKKPAYTPIEADQKDIKRAVENNLDELSNTLKIEGFSTENTIGKITMEYILPALEGQNDTARYTDKEGNTIILPHIIDSKFRSSASYAKENPEPVLDGIKIVVDKDGNLNITKTDKEEVDNMTNEGNWQKVNPRLKDTWGS